MSSSHVATESQSKICLIDFTSAHHKTIVDFKIKYNVIHSKVTVKLILSKLNLRS